MKKNDYKKFIDALYDRMNNIEKYYPKEDWEEFKACMRRLARE